MTSKPNSIATVSLEALSQATRTSRFINLTSSAARLVPLRRTPLLKSTSDCSAKSGATEPECRVRFTNKVAVRRSLSRKDYTPEEIGATWFNHDDYQRMRQECIKEIRKMNEGGNCNDKKYSGNGLEGHTKTGSAAKAQKRAFAINAVLDEQMNQWMVGWM
jgi:hypothetical protein